MKIRQVKSAGKVETLISSVNAAEYTYIHSCQETVGEGRV